MYHIVKVSFYILILCFFQVKHIFADNLLIGDDCKLKNNKSGTCMLINDCTSALKELRDGIFPKLCSFQQKTPIICCAEALNASVILEENKKPTSERISKQKCREYGQSVFELKDVLILPNSYDIKQNISNCKIESGLIIEGTIARPGEFPHMALIGYEENGETNWECGGVLISDKFILTTAACSQTRIPPNKVRLGTTQVKTEENKQYIEDVKISEIIRHPNFKRPKIYNDIALIKLQHPVKFNKNLRPACLSDSNQKRQNKFYLSGWEFLPYKPLDELLKYVVERESNEECNNQYNKTENRLMPQGIDNNTQLCMKIYRDSCGISIGSPLQTYNSEVYCMYDVQGILSIGNICYHKSSAIYTNISSYLDWIENIVWP